MTALPSPPVNRLSVLGYIIREVGCDSVPGTLPLRLMDNPFDEPTPTEYTISPAESFPLPEKTSARVCHGLFHEPSPVLSSPVVFTK